MYKFNFKHYAVKISIVNLGPKDLDVYFAKATAKAIAKEHLYIERNSSSAHFCLKPSFVASYSML